MKTDPQVRLVTICDTNGIIMYSDQREGMTNLLTREESKRSLELAVNSWKIRTKLAPKIGKGKYVLAEYEKIKTYHYAVKRQPSSLYYHRTRS